MQYAFTPPMFWENKTQTIIFSEGLGYDFKYYYFE